MEVRPQLRALADRVGVLSGYRDVGGVEHFATDAVRERVLRAMGFDVSSESAAGESLLALERAGADRLVDAVRVVRGCRAWERCITVRCRGGAGECVAWRVTLRLEDGALFAWEGESEVPGGGVVSVGDWPVEVGEGYHDLTVEVACGAERATANQRLIVVPEFCHSLPGARAVGVWTNLYSVRRAGDWGVGDFSSLAAVGEACGSCGLDFVGVNPLHALDNTPMGSSPYLPSSRLFRNIVYVDVSVVPELAACSRAREMIASADFQATLGRLRGCDAIDYEAVAGLKTAVMRLLHGQFVKSVSAGGSDRAAAFGRYISEKGGALTRFATYCVVAEMRAKSCDDVVLDDVVIERLERLLREEPSAPQVTAFQATHARALNFFRFVQFELDRQLADAERSVRGAGMGIGLYADLAVGAQDGRADACAYPGLFVPGVELGAPPDPAAEQGQTWGFPPLHPLKLAERGYDYWVDLLRASMAHCGMLRIDHVLGLFRQFWVPTDGPASEGAYVRMPADDLLGILALESRRSETVIVGEDLGTVPPDVPERLAERGVLSSRVLYFEREWEGRFRRPEAYAGNALVTTATHDHVPLAGFFQHRDIEIRKELGLYESEEAVGGAHGEREHAKRMLIAALNEAGLGAGEHSPFEVLCADVYRFLLRTPCAAVGVSLDDLAGEVEPVNVPGVSPDRYASWTRRMRADVGEVLGRCWVVELLGELGVGLGHGDRAGGEQ